MPVSERYLVDIEFSAVPGLTPDVLVLGSGVAGLSAALAAASTSPDTQVLIVTKSSPEEGNTYYAQGGIAAALAKDDSPEIHLQDTLAAGAGLCDEEAVRVLVQEGVARCREMIDWETPFDREDGDIAFTMEGAHSRRRVMHASGDATGKAMEQTLLDRARATSNIQILEHHFAIDLLHYEGECFGALALDKTYGRLIKIEAGATIVATGGLGRIYRETTNPEVATGDGYASCFRAGCVLRDMEFVQFHPTTLYLPGAPRFLISEAVRGEGAYLLNQEGERFMSRYAVDGELAPRDVVSQSIFREMNQSGGNRVFLDLRHLDSERVATRFPTIQGICADYGLDLTRDLIPVRPSCHYMMGGVKTDLEARTNVTRLYACGEVASTGVHGANRLASNSLLEGLVFGARAGTNAAADASQPPRRFPPRALTRHSMRDRAISLDLEDVVRTLKALAWRHLGVFRSGETLREAEANILAWERYIMPEQFQARGGWEIQNMLTIAKVIARAALQRTESRGAHQRTDYPEPDAAWARHTELSVYDWE